MLDDFSLLISAPVHNVFCMNNTTETTTEIKIDLRKKANRKSTPAHLAWNLAWQKGLSNGFHKAVGTNPRGVIENPLTIKTRRLMDAKGRAFLAAGINKELLAEFKTSVNKQNRKMFECVEEAVTDWLAKSK
jgi:hypothetical protein